VAYTEKFQDNFTETSDTDLTSHTPDTGTSWTATTGNAGTAQVDAGTDTVVQPYHSGGLQYNGFIANKGSAWDTNQRVETTGYYQSIVAPAVRVHDGSTDVNAYTCYWLTNQWRLYRIDEGGTSPTQLDSAFDSSPATTDTVQLTAESGTQSFSINSGAFTGSATDTAFSVDGSPGLVTRRTLTADGITSFSGLDEAASGVTASGTPSIAAITASGAVETQLGASGTPSIAEITATGLVGHINSASGTPSLADITASGAVQTTLGAYGTATADRRGQRHRHGHRDDGRGQQLPHHRHHYRGRR
jgi:hypothetical protein